MRICTKPQGAPFCGAVRGTECPTGCKHAADPATLAGIVRRAINVEILKNNCWFIGEGKAVRICEMVIERNLTKNGGRV